MTKMSKAIAVLGIVAGLGVAALPLSSYAVTVIDGPQPTENPVAGATYDGTRDGSVSGNTTVKLKVNDILSMELDHDTTTIVDLGDGSDVVDMTVKVVTNNTTGYNLNIKGSTTVNSPVTATDLANEYKDRIQAGSGTFATPKALTADSYSAWGYRVSNGNANVTTTYTQFTEGLYAGVTAGGQEIVNVSKPTTNEGDVTTVTFGADVKNGQAAGEYVGQVTFTASNNATSGN